MLDRREAWDDVATTQNASPHHRVIGHGRLIEVIAI